MKKINVLITGGGLAGLSAAWELSQHEQFNVRLIEKSNRLGGRVHSVETASRSVDVGGFLVYPWYRRYHELVESLNLGDELIRIPQSTDYYAPFESRHDRCAEGFKLSFSDLLNILWRVFPNPVLDSDPAEPILHAYRDLSIQDYVYGLGIDPRKAEEYLRAFDTYLQGYCYGGVREQKMAFMASILFRNMRYGNLYAASYMKKGSKRLVDALQTELQKRGVQIDTDCRMIAEEKTSVLTEQGSIQADAFIFCHPPADMRYTHYLTATISCEAIPQINGDREWLASFYKADPRQKYSILSVVNLDKLYPDKATGQLNLNIRVGNREDLGIGTAHLLEVIRMEMRACFPQTQHIELLERTHWDEAMPLAAESFVESVRSIQGKAGRYYAGDYMGCPSMETALQSGKRAAQELIKNSKI
jgi:hypothetical protein